MVILVEIHLSQFTLSVEIFELKVSVKAETWNSIWNAAFADIKRDLAIMYTNDNWFVIP